MAQWGCFWWEACQSSQGAGDDDKGWRKGDRDPRMVLLGLASAHSASLFQELGIMLELRARQGRLPCLGRTCSSGVEHKKVNSSTEKAWGPLLKLPAHQPCCLISFPGQPGKGGLCFHGSGTSLDIDLVSFCSGPMEYQCGGKRAG